MVTIFVDTVSFHYVIGLPFCFNSYNILSTGDSSWSIINNNTYCILAITTTQNEGLKISQENKHFKNVVFIICLDTLISLTLHVCRLFLKEILF